jgi:hypothetical protein
MTSVHLPQRDPQLLQVNGSSLHHLPALKTTFHGVRDARVQRILANNPQRWAFVPSLVFWDTDDRNPRS